jgi:hypothetical protein
MTKKWEIEMCRELLGENVLENVIFEDQEGDASWRDRIGGCEVNGIDMGSCPMTRFATSGVQTLLMLVFLFVLFFLVSTNQMRQGDYDLERGSDGAGMDYDLLLCSVTVSSGGTQKPQEISE